MTALSIQPPFPTITDTDGQPLENGYIWIGTANLPAQTTPISVYWDAALTQPAAQPIRTQGGYPVNAGTPARLYVGSDYSILVQNSRGATVYSAPQATERYSDPVITGVDSSEVTFLQSGTGAVVRTAQSKMRDVVSVLDFGAVGDGVTDDRAAVLSAATECRVRGAALTCPAGLTLRLSASTDLTGIRNIDIRSPILIPSGTITVGSLLGPADIYFSDVTNGTSTIIGAPPVNPVVRLTGVANYRFEIGACNHLQLYADASVTNNRLVAYGSCFLNGPTNLLSLTDSGTALSYVNENRIFGGRINRLRIIGVGYAHNHNEFSFGTFEESEVEITMTGNGVSCNRVTSARFENVVAAPGITFGAGTYSNSIICTWSGVGNPRNQFVVPFITVSDAGMGNIVTTQSLVEFEATPIFQLGLGVPMVANASASSSPNPFIAPQNGNIDNLTTVAILRPGLYSIVPDGTSRFLALSGPIPVELGDVLTFDADYIGSSLRAAIYVLDGDQRPLTSEGVGGPFIDQPSSTFDGTYGRYLTSSDLSATILRQSPAAIIRSEVRFIRVGLLVGATAVPIVSASCTLHTQNVNRAKAQAAALQRDMQMSLPGAPTEGYLPAWTVVFDRTLKANRWVSFQHETTPTSILSAGTTSVTATAISTVANGDIVGILLDDLTTHWSAVSSLVGSTFTITAIPAGRYAVSGARMVFNRWAS